MRIHFFTSAHLVAILSSTGTIRALFQIDSDGSGDVDLEELEAGLRVLMEQQRDADRQRASASADVEEAEFWLRKQAQIEHVAEVTKQAEAVEAELQALTDHSSLEQRVGALMMTKEIVSLVSAL